MVIICCVLFFTVPIVFLLSNGHKFITKRGKIYALVNKTLIDTAIFLYYNEGVTKECFQYLLF
jgi:hypothetical protein